MDIKPAPSTNEKGREREREHVKVKETVTHSVSNREGDITLYTPSYTHKSRSYLSQFTLARQTLPTQGSTG